MLLHLIFLHLRLPHSPVVPVSPGRRFFLWFCYRKAELTESVPLAIASVYFCIGRVERSGERRPAHQKSQDRVGVLLKLALAAGLDLHSPRLTPIFVRRKRQQRECNVVSGFRAWRLLFLVLFYTESERRSPDFPDVHGRMSSFISQRLARTVVLYFCPSPLFRANAGPTPVHTSLHSLRHAFSVP